MIKGIFAGIGALVLFLAFVFGMNLFGLANYSFFAPKYRAVDNQVFKQSEQYNDGMVRDLENLQLEYINADQAHKDALRAIVLHRFSVYPEDKLPPNLRNFYNDLRSGKN
jgi:hypothetical protein